MSLIGNLEEVSLAEVLQLLSHGKHTGVLTLTSQQANGKIVFNYGCVVYASSYPDNRLGYTLVRKGIISITDLKDVLHRQKAGTGHKPFGTLLVEGNLITPTRLRSELQTQILQVVRSLIGWKEGIFHFKQTAGPPVDFLLTDEGLKVDFLLLENMRRHDEDLLAANQAG